MRALFTSKNLIGDALYIQPALKAWQDQHPDWDIDLLTLDDHITCLYRGMGIRNLRILFQWFREWDDDKNESRSPYDFEHEFQVNRAFSLGEQKHYHIAQAYMELLGLPVPEYPPRVEYTPPEGPTERGLVLLSIFSNSCASREGKAPNKMFSFATWLPILTLARQLGKVAVLGGSKDKGQAPLPIRDEEYYTGRPLTEIARLLRDAKLLITIDNGMGHLAASQGTPTILFYPKCLDRSWIVPSGNKKLYVYQMDPLELNVHIGTLVVREGIKSLLGDQHEEADSEVQEKSSEASTETESDGGGSSAGVL
jgi:ADP-heptose:LPS heptosyltransferase